MEQMPRIGLPNQNSSSLLSLIQMFRNIPGFAAHLHHILANLMLSFSEREKFTAKVQKKFDCVQCKQINYFSDHQSRIGTVIYDWRAYNQLVNISTEFHEILKLMKDKSNETEREKLLIIDDKLSISIQKLKANLVSQEQNEQQILELLSELISCFLNIDEQFLENVEVKTKLRNFESDFSENTFVNKGIAVAKCPICDCEQSERFQYVVQTFDIYSLPSQIIDCNTYIEQLYDNNKVKSVTIQCCDIESSVESEVKFINFANVQLIVLNRNGPSIAKIPPVLQCYCVQCTITPAHELVLNTIIVYDSRVNHYYCVQKDFPYGHNNCSMTVCCAYNCLTNKTDDEKPAFLKIDDENVSIAPDLNYFDGRSEEYARILSYIKVPKPH